jgi:hypothetical protein
MPFGDLSLLIFYKFMKKILFSLSFISFLLIAPLTNAAVLSPEVRNKINDNAEQFNSSAGYDSNADVLTIARAAITVILGLLAVIFLFLLIFAGFKWMTSAGDADDIKKAKSTIKTAIIGLVIILASYGITYFIFNQITFFSGAAPIPNEQTNFNTGSG